MSVIFHLDESIRQEFTIEADGKAFASRRAITRLCGINESSVRDLLGRAKEGAGLDLPRSIQAFAGKGFEGAVLPDIVATGIIEYYAFDAERYCTDQARLVYRTFATIGFRSWIQSELGWSAPLTPAPTTPLGLVAALAQEMVKLEEQVNQQGQAIMQLTNQVNHLAQTRAVGKVTTKRAISPDGVTADLEKLLSLIQRKGGTLSVREFQHSLPSRYRPNAKAVRRWFCELESLGYGNTVAAGKTFSFTTRPELTVLS